MIELENNPVNSQDFLENHITSKDEKRLALISVKFDVSLPAVSRSSLHALLNANKFVDLDDLLKQNAQLSYRQKSIALDAASNQLKLTAKTSEKDVTGSLDASTRAISVFMPYRVAIDAELSTPLIRYLDTFCALA